MILAPAGRLGGWSVYLKDFDYDGGGAGKGGTATLLVGGAPVVSGRIERTQVNRRIRSAATLRRSR